MWDVGFCACSELEGNRLAHLGEMLSNFMWHPVYAKHSQTDAGNCCNLTIISYTNVSIMESLYKNIFLETKSIDTQYINHVSIVYEVTYK